MSSQEIEQNVKRIFENLSKEDFLFDLLLAYGISKTSITRLRSGDFNLSTAEGEILYKKKIFFKQEKADKLLSSIESVAKEDRILKHSPRFAVVTDYKNLVAKDLRLGKNLDILIQDLPNHYSFFLPLAGSEVYQSTNDNEADRNAAYKMAGLYDELVTKNAGIYNSKESIHNLNIFLSRLLFCYFAEDTEIFKTESVFTDTLAQQTAENGSDTHQFLDRLFIWLNTADKERDQNVPEYFTKFPYVNGGLFRDTISSPIFTPKARKILVELGELNWRDINPDIFGSMIQAVVIPEYRSDLGMHYTSVPNILKLIKPLFLDELYEGFEKNQNNPKALDRLLIRLSKIKFFDPACGSGNFLIITYKEIRLLEIKIIQRLLELSELPAGASGVSVQSKLEVHQHTLKAVVPAHQTKINLHGAQKRIYFTEISLTQFFGIELDDFAHEMAILSLWLAEHQMNKYFDEQLAGYGQSKPILPLKQAGKIVQGNAAREDWKTVCPIGKDDEVYIVGNPPYLGSRNQDENQKLDLDLSIAGIKFYRKLDYIAIWFYKAAKYLSKNKVKAAFVSTNSICQGEQVGVLWKPIFDLGIEIDFAHTSFKWTNNAKGNAGVTVVIIGVRNVSNDPKYLISGNVIIKTSNISPHLESGQTRSVEKRTKPLSKFPDMRRGNMPNDNELLRISLEEKNQLTVKYPTISRIIKKQIGADEFINGLERYCYWISDEDLPFALTIPEVKLAIDKCFQYRINSKDKTLHSQALKAHQFREFFACNDNSLLIPIVSSESREYIPIGFVDNETVIPNSAQVIYDGNPFIFGILSSRMHNLWVKQTAGRLENRFRYSIFLCYNTFPFPDISAKQKENLSLYVFSILDERAKHPEKTMAQLYNPSKMPIGLRKAHQELDAAVEQCYRLQPFASDTERLEYLFKLYEEMTKKDTLFAKEKKPKKVKEE